MTAEVFDIEPKQAETKIPAFNFMGVNDKAKAEKKPSVSTIYGAEPEEESAEVQATSVIINGFGAHRKGDTGPTNCPHGGTFQSVGASSTVMINGKGAGASTVCMGCGLSGSHTGGSSNVVIGG